MISTILIVTFRVMEGPLRSFDAEHDNNYEMYPSSWESPDPEAPALISSSSMSCDSHTPCQVKSAF